MDVQIGVSKLDITPNYGSPTRRWHVIGEGARIRQIAAPMYVRTVAICDGKQLTTITSMEIACLYQCHLDHIRKLAHKMSPVPIDHIILHETHQHSDSFIEYEPNYDAFGINDLAFDLPYINNLFLKVASSICLAVQSMTKACIGRAKGAVNEGIASCRRIQDQNGALIWRGSRPGEKLRALPRGLIDPEVGLIGFCDQAGHPLALLVNYACHPSAAGGDSPSVCSADYAGFACDRIEREYGGIALFVHGCSGDINPGKYVRGDAPAASDRIADAKRMGDILAYESLKQLSNMETTACTSVRVEQKQIDLPVQKEASDTALCYDRALAAIKQWKKDGRDPRTDLRKYIMSKKMRNGCVPVTIFATRFNDAAAVWITGEPFTEYGLQIKEHSRAELTLVASTCGEDPFYMPTRSAFAQKGYETGYIAVPETGETLAQQAMALLDKTMDP